MAKPVTLGVVHDVGIINRHFRAEHMPYSERTHVTGWCSANRTRLLVPPCMEHHVYIYPPLLGDGHRVGLPLGTVKLQIEAPGFYWYK